MTRRVDARMLAVISNRCLDMSQAAACSYYSHRDDNAAHHAETVLREFRSLAEEMGFELVERKLEAAE